MPQVFKALASIGVWTLWISAWALGIGALVHGIVIGELFGSRPPSMSFMVAFAVALGYGVGSVVVMKLRKSLE